MKKGLKNFWIVVGVTILFFIASLIIQFYFSVAISLTTAILGGVMGLILSSILTDLKKDQKEFSIGFLILEFLMLFIAVSILFAVSAMGNEMLVNISVICFGVGSILAVICLVFLAIKELIKAIKNYK